MARPRFRPLAFPLAVVLLLAISEGAPQAGLLPSVFNAVSGLVDGTVGAVLKQGVWTVQVPAGAFSGAASITMTVPIGYPRVCQLEISPADKNTFSRQVILTAKLPTVTSGMRIEWFDQQHKTWMPVPGSAVDLSRGTVSASVWHFSEYRVGDGRSGW